MSSTFVCPGCNANLRLEDNVNSPEVLCPQCGAVVQVPLTRKHGGRRSTSWPYDTSPNGPAARTTAQFLSRLTLGLAVSLSLLAGVLAVGSGMSSSLRPGGEV